MSDRYAAMQWAHGDGPCPTCGQRPDGIATYAPPHTQAISPEARAAYHAFAAKPEGAPKT